MKKSYYYLGCFFLLSSCSSSTNHVVSQDFYHKYGLCLSKEEWIERDQDGKVISTLENGVTLTQQFENGQLHGQTTYSYPYNDVIEQIWDYEQGELVKITLLDKKGIPAREEFFTSDEEKSITHWDVWGAPIRIEDYHNEKLLSGTYFTPTHEVESLVENGNGIRIKRNREGILLAKDQILDGNLVQRTNFHENGEIQMVASYENFKLHGDKIEYTPLGQLHQISHWKNGLLDGIVSIFREGEKVREIQYQNNKKNGTERSFDQNGNILEEIAYKDDQRHGPTYIFGTNTFEEKWYFKDRPVSQDSFTMLQNREEFFAE